MAESSAWKLFLVLGIIFAAFVGYQMYQDYQVDQQRAANRYNGFDFALAANDIWVTRIEWRNQPYDVPFYYHPRETEEVVVHPNVTHPVTKDIPEHIFISIAPDAGSIPVIAGVEIASITGQKYDILNIPTSSALSAPAETPVETPIINCAQPETVPEGSTVIQFILDPEANAIVKEGQCVILFYKNPEESIRVADRYAYMLLGIMN